VQGKDATIPLDFIDQTLDYVTLFNTRGCLLSQEVARNRFVKVPGHYVMYVKAN
jgi:hypothetical protein